MTGRLDGDFPVGHCARCEKEVLAGVVLDPHGDARRCCVHCDAELDPAMLRWVPEVELERVGYAAWREPAGCGSGGCGAGRCGRGAAVSHRTNQTEGSP